MKPLIPLLSQGDIKLYRIKNIKIIFCQYAYSAIIIILAVLMVLISSSCCFPIEKKAKETETNKESDRVAESVDSGLVNINTDFALSIFTALSVNDENSNVFISPLSISLMMAMAYNGAQNNTRKEIAEALQFDNFTDEQLNSAFNALLASMENVDDMVELYTGNSIWLRNDNKADEAFKDIIKDYYNASIYNEDFNSPDTADKINKWANEKTQGRISNITSADAIKDTVMYLANTIYFKGQWKDKFNPEYTEEKDFFLIDKSIKKVQMMCRTEDYMYFEGDSFKMLRIPYGRAKISMHVILPDEDKDINQLISSLSTDLINQSIEDYNDIEVALEFPKFNIEYQSEDLGQSLKKLGINDAFIDGSADFNRICGQLYISRIDHKAIIEVNEEGTVAAAAGGFQGFMAEIPASFIVNRPFILFIMDDRTGNILFTGKITEL
jgi:serine protease inhibitor